MHKLLVTGCALGVFLVGCGGAVATALFDDAGGGGNDDSGVTGNDSGQSQPDATPPPADAGPEDATTTIDSSVVDAAEEDVFVPPPDPGVFCNVNNQTTYCDPGTQFCCVSFQGSQCVANNQNCFQAQPIHCDDQADCNGKVCCGQLNVFGNQNYYYSDVSCQTTCNVSQNVPGSRRFCDPNAQTDECQQIGLTCGPSNVVKGYYVCQ